MSINKCINWNNYIEQKCSFFGYLVKFEKVNVYAISPHEVLYTKNNNNLLVLYYDCYIGNDNQYFFWVDFKQLDNYKLYPESTIKFIKSDKLEHIIEKMEF